MKLMILSNIIILPMLNHPISMGSMMILQTSLMCIIHNKIFNLPWFNYIMFITIIGGLMIMFIYMASIASNEKFKMKMYIIISWIIVLTAMMTNKEEMLNKINEQKISTMNLEQEKSTMKFFNKPKMNITIMLMLMMLLTMIAVTNISNSFEGPLKSTYV